MSTPAAAPRRNPALVTVDIVAGILFVIFGAVLALVVFTTAVSFLQLPAACGAEAGSCGPTVMVVAYGLMFVSVLALFLGFGMFIVSLIRKKLAFYWPLIGAAVTLVLFYVGAWVLGAAIA